MSGSTFGGYIAGYIGNLQTHPLSSSQMKGKLITLSLTVTWVAIEIICILSQQSRALCISVGLAPVYILTMDLVFAGCLKLMKKEIAPKQLREVLAEGTDKELEEFLQDPNTNKEELISGYTPLLYSILKLSEARSLLLIQAGADVNVRTPIGQSALDLLITLERTSPNSKSGVIFALLDKGADPLLVHYADRFLFLIKLLFKENVAKADEIWAKVDTSSSEYVQTQNLLENLKIHFNDDYEFVCYLLNKLVNRENFHYEILKQMGTFSEESENHLETEFCNRLDFNKISDEQLFENLFYFLSQNKLWQYEVLQALKTRPQFNTQLLTFLLGVVDEKGELSFLELVDEVLNDLDLDQIDWEQIQAIEIEKILKNLFFFFQNKFDKAQTIFDYVKDRNDIHKSLYHFLKELSENRDIDTENESFKSFIDLYLHAIDINKLEIDEMIAFLKMCEDENETRSLMLLNIRDKHKFEKVHRAITENGHGFQSDGSSVESE